MNMNLLIFVRRFGGSFTFYNLLESVTKTLNTQYELERVEKLLKNSKHLTPELSNKITENIINNIRWIEKNMKPIKNWLKDSS